MHIIQLLNRGIYPATINLSITLYLHTLFHHQFTPMTHLVKIGNSQGIRIPKPLPAISLVRPSMLFSYLASKTGFETTNTTLSFSAIAPVRSRENRSIWPNRSVKIEK